MKNILLLLLFVFSSSAYAQIPPGLLNPYSLCDTDSNPNDGYTTFNLPSTDPIGSLGLNPTIYSVTFHTSVMDANDNVNVILNPSTYTNATPNYQIIGIRFLNSSNNEVNVSGMEIIVNPTVTPDFITPSPICSGQNIMALPTVSNNGITGTWTPSTIDNTVTSIYTFTPNVGQCAATVTVTVFVNPLPTANPAQLTFCYPLELAIYNLNAANNQITNGVPSSIVSYHETLTDAQLGFNPVGPTYFPLFNPGLQVLYARVQNTTGCFSITTLTLNTNNCGGCPTPTNLVASQITDTSFALSWISGGPVGYSLACIVPQGMPPSDANAVVTSTGPGPYVFTGLSPNACYSVYAKAVCSPTTSSQWSDPLTICMPDCANNGVCSQALVLTAFLDSNNNGIKDTGEVNFNNGTFVYQINDSGTNLYGNSNDGSYYIFDENPSNSYDISFAVNTELGAYYTSSVLQNNVTLPSGSGANNLYFPIVNIQPYVDAQVNLFPSGQPRPGFDYGNFITYQNNGSQTIANGTLTYIKNSNLSITSISQAGTTPTSAGFTYDFTNLEPFEVRSIYVYLAVPTIPTVNLGDLLTNTVSVQINNDADLTNNAATLTQIVVGSYDPNDKSESHGGRIGLDTFTSNDYLYYTINFENTGTASAEFIRLEDTLDAALDESTFEMINASHTVNTKREGNQLTWNFRTINLPPTITNPNDSHGYVYFRIKPRAGYAVGDIIPNTASIYFDYNPAIVTNTFNTEFFQTLGNPSLSSNEFQLYPNPAKGAVQITQNNNQAIENIQFYDVTGKTVKSISNVNNFQTSVYISALAKGIYFVEITTENHLKLVKKLVIE